ncbi:MAG: ABC transporter permease subunit [Bacilli bacterium]
MIKMPIIYMEMKRSFTSFLIWVLSIGLMMVFVIVLYPMVKDMYAAIPEEFMEMLDAFGGIPDSLMEYFATEGGLMMEICAAIYAVFLGFNAIGKEEREHSSDIIYSLPISRRSFFLHKWLAVVIQVVAFSLILYLFNLVSLLFVEQIAVGQFTFFSLMFTVMMLIIASLGFILGALVKGTVKSMSSLLIIFPMYILTIISSMTQTKWLQNLKYLSVFTFSDPVNLLKTNGEMEILNLIIFVGITILGLIYALWQFEKREFLD